MIRDENEATMGTVTLDTFSDPLTQRGLASLASVSHSLLTKVESGSRPASEGFIAACARALSV